MKGQTRPEIRAMMAQECVVSPYLSRDMYGVAQFDTPITYPARIEPRNEIIQQPDGTDILARSTIYLPANALVGSQDLVTTPGERERPPLLVRTVPDLDGTTHHVEVLL